MDEDYKRLYISVLVVSIICLILAICYIYLAMSRIRAWHSLDICNASMKETAELNGLWFSEGYYCVWAQGRNLEEIKATDTHEACHALVYDDPEHYCGWYVNCTAPKGIFQGWLC